MGDYTLDYPVFKIMRATFSDSPVADSTFIEVVVRIYASRRKWNGNGEYVKEELYSASFLNADLPNGAVKAAWLLVAQENGKVPESFVDP